MLESGPEIKKTVSEKMKLEIAEIITNDERNMVRDSREEAQADVKKINAQLGEDLAFVAKDLDNIKIKFDIPHLGAGFDVIKEEEE